MNQAYFQKYKFDIKVVSILVTICSYNQRSNEYKGIRVHS